MFYKWILGFGFTMSFVVFVIMCGDEYGQMKTRFQLDWISVISFQNRDEMPLSFSKCGDQTKLKQSADL
jgi:hypothetical protein